VEDQGALLGGLERGQVGAALVVSHALGGQVGGVGDPALPAHQRYLSLARAGYTADQIAEATNTTTAAVNRCLRAARAALHHTDPDT
jgi:hypothetical protein